MWHLMERNILQLNTTADVDILKKFLDIFDMNIEPRKKLCIY